MPSGPLREAAGRFIVFLSVMKKRIEKVGDQERNAHFQTNYNSRIFVKIIYKLNKLLRQLGNDVRIKATVL